MRKFSRAIAAALIVAVVLPAATFAAWPVANRYSWVSQGYHLTHKANDIASYSGTPIVPIRSGKVIFAGWKNNCGGYQVWVSHGSGLYTAYYHMRSTSARYGAYVRQSSTVLGRVGQTGCATGNHLHVEVWRGRPWASGSYRVKPWAYIDNGTYFPYRYR